MGTSYTPPPIPPQLSDDLQRVLDFARGQADAEIKNIERLFERAKTMFGWILIVTTVVAGFFGLSTYLGLNGLVTKLVSDAMKQQVPAQINQQLKQENVEAILQKILREKTEAQFQNSINAAVAAQMNTPERQKILEVAIQRQVEAWFSQHKQIVQSAAQQQVDLLTEHLRNREKILKLGDAALTQSPKGRPALQELQKLIQTSPDESMRDAATAEKYKIASFWASTGFVANGHQIQALDKKGFKYPYPTCELLKLLRGSLWQDRVRAATALQFRGEQGVPEALLNAMSDDYLEVAVHAGKSFAILTEHLEDQDIFPNLEELNKWWNKEGKAITAKLKPLTCE